VGCVGKEIEIGRQESALSIDRCYGKSIHCNTQEEPTVLVESNIETCSEKAVGALKEDSGFYLRFDAYPWSQGKVTPDGSVWVLESTTRHLGEWQLPPDYFHVSRYSAEGVFVGSTSEFTATWVGNGPGDYKLTVDAKGNAILTVYESYPNCPVSGSAPPVRVVDCPPEERTTVRVFDAGLQEVGVPLNFRGLSNPRVVGGKPGDLTISGTVTTYANFGTDEYPAQDQQPWIVKDFEYSPPPMAVNSHGVLAHVRDGIPVWTQSKGTSASIEKFATVLDLMVDAWGSSFIIGRYAQVPFSGSGLYEFWTLSRFDTYGNLLWSQKLPNGDNYTRLVEAAKDGVIIVGAANALYDRVLSISSNGKNRWSYRVLGDLGVASDTESGSVVALSPKPDANGARIGYRLAFISNDGTGCRLYELPPAGAADAPEGPTGIFVASPFVYVQSEAGIRRYRLPTE
jgi:hypothetical protein